MTDRILEPHQARTRTPTTYEDLLDPKFKRKIQYSTPGQAGDGTAFMLQTFKTFGGKEHEEVAAYAIQDGGKLRLLNRQSARGSAACYLDVDPDGHELELAERHSRP